MATSRQTRSSTRRSFPPPDTQDKENGTRSKAKRAQSLGGAAAIQFKELVIKPQADELSPGKRKRRSAVPRKSILKAKLADDATQDYTAATQTQMQTAPLPASMSQDFTTEMNFTTSSMTDERRKSLARRVSFASHAHVRLFPKDAAKLASEASSSPSHPSAPASPDASASSIDPSSPPPATTEHQHPPPPKLAFDLPSPSQDERSTHPHRRQSVQDARALLSAPPQGEGDSEESSMDVDDDDTTGLSTAPLPAPPPLLTAPAPRVSLGSTAGDESMDITGVFPSAASLPNDDTAEHTASTKSSDFAPSEFLVALGKNVPASNPNRPPRPSVPSARDKAWAALEGVVHGVDNGSDEEAEEGEEGEEDMELMDATGRINTVAVRRASTATAGTTGSAMDLEDEEDATGRILEARRRASGMTDGEDMELDEESDAEGDEDEDMDMVGQGGGEGEGEKTVDLTAMLERMGMLHSSASDGPAQLPNTSTSTTTRPGPPSPRKSFTAAFAPSYAPQSPPKRPASPVPGTPNKRQALLPPSASSTPRGALVSRPSPSPLRQSPGRVLSTPRGAAQAQSPGRILRRASMGSVLGSPGRVVVRSPGVRAGAAVADEEEGEDEEGEGEGEKGVPASQSQNQGVFEGLEDISGLGQGESSVDDDTPALRTLTIDEFLEMTGVTFMEGLAVTRRSAVGAGVLGGGMRGGEGEGGDERRPTRPAAEYVRAAAVGIPQLEMYLWAAQELKKNIAAGQATVRAFEEQVEGANPVLFREWLVAGEDERPLMEGQLKIMKAHARLSAKEKWYRWRQGLVLDLHGTVAEHLAKLQEDHEYLRQTRAELDSALPRLRERHAALGEELGLERRSIVELEGDSPEQLRELKEGIGEQTAQIDSFKGELAEIATKTERLNAKLGDIEAQKAQALAVVRRSEQHCNMLRSCTRSEVFRLKEDYESLQRMHLWTPVRVSPAETVLLYDARVQVHVLGKKRSLGVDGITLLPAPAGAAAEDKQIGSATRVLFHMMQSRLRALPTNDLQGIVAAVSATWTAISHLQSELRLLRLKYPVSISSTVSGGASKVPAGLSITVHAMLPAREAKVDLTFVVGPDVLHDWPASVSRVSCDARVVYGEVELERLVRAARARIAQADENAFYGFLVDACREAVLSEE